MYNYKNIVEMCNEIKGSLSSCLFFPESCDYVMFRYSKNDIKSVYSCEDSDFTVLFDELSDTEINGIIEDVILDDIECFLIISSNERTERCISVVSSIGEHIKCWKPKFDEIFNKLMNSNPRIIYNIMTNISNKIGIEEDIDLEEVINENFSIDSLDDNYEYDLELNLHLAILREIMITEDIRYNKPNQKGRLLMIEAFEDIAINKMEYGEWKIKYKLE